jgi:hypothetical protein
MLAFKSFCLFATYREKVLFLSEIFNKKCQKDSMHEMTYSYRREEQIFPYYWIFKLRDHKRGLIMAENLLSIYVL